MNEQSGKRLSAGWLVMSYVGMFFAGYILLNLVIWLLDSMLSGTGFDNPAIGILLVLFVASTLGQYWLSAEKARPSSGRAWLIAVLCGIVTLAMQAFTLWFALQGGDIPGAPTLNEFANEELTTLVMLGAGLFVFSMLVIRLGLWWGFRQAEKAAVRARQSDRQT